jgi:hypothetical protein
MTHHPIIFPMGLLTTLWTPLIVIAPEDAKWMVGAFAANGVITVAAAWLLLRQYIGTLVVGAQGFDQLQAQVQRLNRIHRKEITDYERKKIGGPDTPMDEKETPP